MSSSRGWLGSFRGCRCSPAERDADSPCTAARCESRWTSRDPEPLPPSRGRRKTLCRHRGFRFRAPRRNRWTLVLKRESKELVEIFTLTDNDLTARRELRPTVEPAGVVLLGADGGSPPQAAEDSEVSAHQVRGHACIEFVTCGGKREAATLMGTRRSRKNKNPIRQFGRKRLVFGLTD